MDRGTMGIRQNYDDKAQLNVNQFQREQKQTSDLLKFNNWIKSVLISKYSKEMCSKLYQILDFPKARQEAILNVLDVGCGRGQDIKKWKIARVRYMVASDFSEESLRVYQERWKSMGQPFRLYTLTADFTKYELYSKISHAYYDIVSAQLCFHYMFKTLSDLRTGLAIGGVFLATIPDSYSILRKINEKGKKINGSTYYENKYFSLKFQKTIFTQVFGNQYGFYLQDAVGSKNKETGEISYTNQWLIQLDKLQQLLKKQHGVQIQYTKNFIQFYIENRETDEYKSLFGKMGLKFQQGKQMDPDLWEIAHLYRVLVCRKKNRGRLMNEYKIDQRIKASIGKQIKRSGGNDNRRERGRSYSGHHNNNNNNRSSHHYGNKRYQPRN